MNTVNTTLKVVKIVGGLVISIGIGAVATNLIKATIPENTKILTKICIGVGSFLVAGMAASAASNHFEGIMDRLINVIKVFTDESNGEPEIIVIEAET